jgi:hypothetical protein
MKQAKQPRQVFLTYAHSDKNAVRRVYHRLTRYGIRVWLDEKALVPGQNWKYEIRQALLRSDHVLVCLSKQFNKQGGFRHEEVKIARRRAESLPDDQIFLIPVRLEKYDLPESLHQWQCVDLFEAEGYKKLLKALHRTA